MKIAEGVFQFKVPMPTHNRVPGGGLRYTLIYAVETPEAWVVIDAGLNTDEGFKAFQEHLTEAKISPGDVSNIVITHGHADHMGLASRFKEMTGAKLAMHKLDAAAGSQRRMYASAGDPEDVAKWMTWFGVPTEELGEENSPSARPDPRGHASSWQIPSTEVDVLLEGGEEVVPGSGLWTIWTPGHSAGHLCLHDRKRRLLFSGDHILPTITPNISLFPGQEGNPLGRFLQSQMEIRELDVDMVHPAHEYSFPNLRKRVDEIIDHHQERMNEMLLQVMDSPKSPWQIASRIHWNVAPWDKLGPGTRRMALMETMSHLYHMESKGQLTRLETESVLLYAHP